MKKSESITKLAIALSKFQGEVKNPSNTATNPYFKSKYAPLETVLNTVRPILSKYGLSIIQSPIAEDGMVGVTTLLLHESGEYMEFPPVMLKMDKQTAQGAGSAITYARRYSLSAIVGISSEDDDDGNHAEETNVKSTMTSNANTSEIKTNRKPSSLSDAQIKRLYTIAHSKDKKFNKAVVDAQVKSKFKKEVKDLTRKEYDTACKGYENMKTKEDEIFESTPLK